MKPHTLFAYIEDLPAEWRPARRERTDHHTIWQLGGDAGRRQFAIFSGGRA